MFFCFFKQKTADEMRISDWSSDVCSSDLISNATARRTKVNSAVFPDLVKLSAKYIWWNPPEYVLEHQLDRLTANVMELGTWEDANRLLAAVGPQRFISVLKSPPPGVLSAKSLAFWHYRLGLPGDPPKPTRRRCR